MHELCADAAAFDGRRLREINARLVALHRDLFCEANPIPVKWAVARMGLIGEGIRLPLTPLSESQHGRVLAAMRKAGVEA
jgi:4-hydroxy-tetrahydrodipicolinate synthase